MPRCRELFDEFHRSEAYYESLQPVLYAACEEGDAFAVAELLAEGLPCDTPAILAAARGGSLEVFDRLLREGAWDIDATLKDIGPPLQVVLHKQELVCWFLNHGANPIAPYSIGTRSQQMNPLLRAAQTSSLAVVKILHAAVTAQESPEVLRDALYAAARSTHSDRLEIVSFLLGQGAKIDACQKEDYERSALHASAEEGQREIAQLLLLRGADPSIRDSLGQTAGDIARLKGHAELAAMLEEPL